MCHPEWVYGCMDVHKCMYVCMYATVCLLYACMYVCVYVFMHVRMYVCTYLYMYACMYVCVCCSVKPCAFLSFVSFLSFSGDPLPAGRLEICNRNCFLIVFSCLFFTSLYEKRPTRANYNHRVSVLKAPVHCRCMYRLQYDSAK